MPFEPLALQSPGASPSSTRRRFWQGGSSTSPIRRARASVVQARGRALSASTCGEELVRKFFTARVGKRRDRQLTTLAFRNIFDETLARRREAPKDHPEKQDGIRVFRMHASNREWRRDDAHS